MAGSREVEVEVEGSGWESGPVGRLSIRVRVV
jgi:hypothetical protein